MPRTGTVNLPLHPGKAPRWLFRRMVPLSRGIARAVVDEYGRAELVRRVADPYWFQAFCCVIGFDWHSSGTTTTGCGALKEALKDGGLGVAVAGGKGGTSRKAPSEISRWGEEFSLGDADILAMRRASRLSAKVDSSLVQDGYQLYHHCFFLTEDGDWSVVQQGMGDTYARRYHWLAETLDRSAEPFVSAPHSGICCDSARAGALDMTALLSRDARDVSLDLVNDGPDRFMRDLRALGGGRAQTSLGEFVGVEEGDGPQTRGGGFANHHGDEVQHTPGGECAVLIQDPPGSDTHFPVGSSSYRPSPSTAFISSRHTGFEMPGRHEILGLDVTERGWRELRGAYEVQPGSYEELVALKGMGPKKIRALALVSQLVYGAEASWKDPVKYSFAHGGKDGIPYPVDRKTYDHSIAALRDALDSAEVGRREKLDAIRRLEPFLAECEVG